jgi:hypothetical protein
MLLAVGAAAAVAVITAVTTFTANAAPAAADPTAGLKQYTDTYRVQHPYNLPQSDRFSSTDGEYSAWILKGDKPFQEGNTTGPRTEMRWATDFSSGEHLWEADVEIDPGTNGTCIMQVHVDGPGEAIYIQVKNGNLYNSVNTLLAKDIVGHWFELASAYNPSSHLVQIWVNGDLALTTHYTKAAGTEFYFKNGVYNLTGARSETHFKDIELWRS